MKALLVKDTTKTLYIGECKDPVIGEEEVLVSVKATALNRADLLQKMGKYPPPPGESSIIGLEMAGVVERTGEKVTRWKPGDRVCALLAGGGYAEKVAVHEGLCLPLPEGMDFEEAAGIPEAFLTAYLNLFELGRLKSGDFCLIHAAASGVGTSAIQLALAAGAIPIATAGSNEKLELCRKLGAHYLINYREEDFAERVRDLTQGHGADVILDPVGASYFEKNLESVAVDGRWIVIGGMGGYEVEKVPLRSLMRKRASLIGSTLRSRRTEDKISLIEHFQDFSWKRFIDGDLSPVIDRVYSWKEANEAHSYMEQNKNLGKIVMTINEEEKS
ncbi:putative PIG3 family NAD(P)H quinone oxidoreductase [Mesobacillus foraminis]|uniref:Putative PIG3 family NAD(P)H quinone oxidoreductase n=2 Tax=Mesobacillus foraminis TaxID=279826 RepID=A0A4R2B4H7_9BACI|nr:putative PIG3 family NAD(P)H quinone oxidoreductase [Mesobacillus foraminis]